MAPIHFRWFASVVLIAISIAGASKAQKATSNIGSNGPVSGLSQERPGLRRRARAKDYSARGVRHARAEGITGIFRR
jgi:hypothetical protein